MERTFVGDIVIISASTGIALAGNTMLRLKYEKPDKSTGYWTASVDPEDSTIAQFMTSGSSLDIRGTWRTQAYVEFVDWQGHGLWAEFKVYSPLC